MLVVESWSELPQPAGATPPVGYAAQAIVGLHGKPGQRFGAGKGINWVTPPDAAAGRFPTRKSQIAFNRHRRGDGPIEDPAGAANFAFADGHVELLKQEELVDGTTGISRFRALWSVIDPELELPPQPPQPGS